MPKIQPLFQIFSVPLISMVYHHISADIISRALQLLDEGWELEKIADILSVSVKSVNRWLYNYEAQGQVDPPSVNRGRRPLLTI